MNFSAVLAMLPPWLKTEDFVFMVTGTAAFFVVVLVWTSLTQRDVLPQRIRALQDRRETMKREIVEKKQKRKQLVSRTGLMHQVVTKMRLMRGERARALAAKLARAGWRSKDAMVVFLFAKISLPLVFGLGSLAYLYSSNPFEWQPILIIGVALIAAAIGFVFPEMILRNTISKRYAKIRKALPDALDLLVICAEAGLNLDSALDRVCREMAQSAEELADEFGLAAIELSFLPERKQALMNLTHRVTLPGVSVLVNTFLQTEKYGTPLVVALRVLSAELRDERIMKAEEKAARLPAIMTVPMIIFILPALFVVLIGPAVLKAIDSFGGG